MAVDGAEAQSTHPSTSSDSQPRYTTLTYLELRDERDRYKRALDWIKGDSSEGFRLVEEALRDGK